MLENVIQKRFKTTSRRIAVPALLTIVLYVIAMFIIFLPQIEQSFISRKKEMIRELTETIWSLVDDYHEREVVRRTDPSRCSAPGNPPDRYTPVRS